METGEEIYASTYSEGNNDDNCIPSYASLPRFLRVQSDESEAFGLNHGDIFMIREDSQGFVYGSVHSSRDEAEDKFRNWLGL